MVFLKLVGRYSLWMYTCRKMICMSKLALWVMTLFPKKDRMMEAMMMVQDSTSKKVE